MTLKGPDRSNPDSALNLDDLLGRAGALERTRFEDAQFVDRINQAILLADEPVPAPYTLGNSGFRWPPLAALLIACLVAWPLIDVQALQALSQSLLGDSLLRESLFGGWPIAQLSLPPALPLLPLTALGLGVFWSAASE